MSKRRHKGKSAGAQERVTTPPNDLDPGELEVDPAELSGAKRAGGLLTTFATLVLAVVVIWAVYRPIGDLYVALAAGRDITEGKITQPDEWSFTASDRVWINQNWGTHLTYYAFYQMGGETGLLVLKFLLLTAMAGFLTLAARERSKNWAVSMLVAAAVLAAGRAFIDQRPNLTSLMLDPLMLFLLYRTREHPKRIWWATLLVAIWANVHGGFIFALGMMGLWTICQTVPQLFAMGFKPTLRKYWHLPAATAVAILLAGFLTPFNLFFAMGSDTFGRNWNLTHPFIMGNKVWRGVREWRSIFDMAEVRYGSVWEFCLLLAALGVVGAARVIVDLAARRRSCKIDHIGTVAVVLVLGLLVVVLSGAALMSTDYQSKPRQISKEAYEQVKGNTTMILAVGLLAVALMLAGARSVVGAIAGERRVEKPKPTQVGTILFDVGLSSLVVWMAFQSRRFIPLAAIMIAPLVAAQLAWLVRQVVRPRLIPAAVATGVVIVLTAMKVLAASSEEPASGLLGMVERIPDLMLVPLGVLVVYWLASTVAGRRFRPVPAAALALLLAVPVGLYGLKMAEYYDRRNPLGPEESFFGRMVGLDRLPTKMADFINANDIHGHMVNEWRWEGYLRWRCPQLKLSLGGRAQQIYVAEDYKLVMTHMRGRPDRDSLLAHYDVLLYAVPEASSHEFASLIAGPDSSWTFLYSDGADTLLVDASDQYGRELVEKAARGELTYPDQLSKTLSLARIATTPAGERIVNAVRQEQGKPTITTEEKFELFYSSVRIRPTLIGYVGMDSFVQEGMSAARIINIYDQQQKRLEEMGYNRPRGWDLLRMRRLLLARLMELYMLTDQPKQVLQARKEWEDFIRQWNRVLDRWGT